MRAKRQILASATPIKSYLWFINSIQLKQIAVVCLGGMSCTAFLAHGQTTVSQTSDTQATTLEGYVELGAQYNDDDAYYFGRYSGLTDAGTAPWLSFYLGSKPAWNSEDTRYWSVQGKHIGLETAQFFATVGDIGQQKLHISYRELPRYAFDDGLSPFQLRGNTHWVLPADWQTTNATTQGFTNLDAYAAPVDVNTERRQFAIHYEKQISGAWSAQANYRRDNKEGNRPLAGMIGSTGGNARAVILPTSIDFETDSMELGLAYTHQRGSVGLDYYGAFFQNKANNFTWQNPYAQQVQWAPGVAFPDSFGQVSTEPDNRFHQLRLTSSYRFAAKTHGALALSAGRMEQDEQFFPYTINNNLVVSDPLNQDSLAGKIDTLNAMVRVTSQPTPRLHLVTRYQLDDRDNKTPQALFQQVSGDAVNQVGFAGARINRPYSFRTQTFSIDSSYRLQSRTRLKLGYQFDLVDRDYSEVNESRESTATLGIAFRAWNPVNLNIDYKYSERRGDRYEGNRPLLETHPPGTIAPDDFENHPLLRKYYLADRERNRMSIKADWYATTTLAIGLGWAYNRDDYSARYLSENTFGLNKAVLNAYTLDISYSPLKDLHLSGFYSLDNYEQKQSGRAFTAAPGQVDDPTRNWQTGNDDRFRTLSATFEFQNVQQRLSWLRDWGMTNAVNLGATYSDARSHGDIEMKVGTALTQAPLTELQTQLREAKIYGDYTWPGGDVIRVAIARETYSSDDFALDAVGLTTMANVLSLGQSSQDYAVNWFRVSYRKTF